MTITFEFDFKDYEDFEKFMNKHEETINMMGEENEQGSLTEQIKKNVVANERLPEHFTFTDDQYAYMVRHHNKGIQKMVKDSRVSVRRKRDSDE